MARPTSTSRPANALLFQGARRTCVALAPCSMRHEHAFAARVCASLVGFDRWSGIFGGSGLRGIPQAQQAATMPQAPFAVGFATSRLTCPSPNSSITSEETVVVLLLGYGLRRSFSLSFSSSIPRSFALFLSPLISLFLFSPVLLLLSPVLGGLTTELEHRVGLDCACPVLTIKCCCDISLLV